MRDEEGKRIRGADGKTVKRVKFNKYAQFAGGDAGDLEANGTPMDSEMNFAQVKQAWLGKNFRGLEIGRVEVEIDAFRDLIASKDDLPGINGRAIVEAQGTIGKAIKDAYQAAGRDIALTRAQSMASDIAGQVQALNRKGQGRIN